MSDHNWGGPWGPGAPAIYGKSEKETIADLEREVAELREALDSAKAAIWDAHYGKGIAVEYARSVTNLIDAALKGKP